MLLYLALHLLSHSNGVFGTKGSSFRALSEKFYNGFNRSDGVLDVHNCIQIVDHKIETKAEQWTNTANG